MITLVFIAAYILIGSVVLGVSLHGYEFPWDPNGDLVDVLELPEILASAALVVLWPICLIIWAGLNMGTALYYGAKFVLKREKIPEAKAR